MHASMCTHAASQRSDAHACRESMQVLGGIPGGTLWAQCVNLLSAAFFTLPVVAGSDPLEVDADMEYDPTDPAAGFRHGMEPAIQRILARARRDSPVYWTHVHRYMPSDSPWCNNAETEPDPSERIPVPAPSCTAEDNDFPQTKFFENDFDADKLAQPRINEVSHVRDVGTRCFCGWVNAENSVCELPDAVSCTAVSAALTAQGAVDLKENWDKICHNNRRYSTRGELFTVMQALNDARAATPNCDELQVFAPTTL